MRTMVAAVLTAYHQPLALREVPLPSPGPGEVRLKVLASGLCSTDIHIRDGKIPTVIPPRITGHEIAGVADAWADGVLDVKEGVCYVVGIDVVCGDCAYCRHEQPNLCPKRVRLGFERDGGFAQYVVVPARNLVPCPDNLDATQAAILPDAVACMHHALIDKARVRAGQKIVIIGLGGLAYQGVQIARYCGASVIATSRQQHKKDLALVMGAQGACDTTESAVRSCAKELWGVEAADVVVDNVGVPETITLALNVVRPGGRVIAVGYDSHNVPINLFDLMLNEKELVGARGSTLDNLRDVVRLTELGFIRPLVTDVYHFRDINQALDDLEHGHVVGRAVVTMGL